MVAQRVDGVGESPADDLIGVPFAPAQRSRRLPRASAGSCRPSLSPAARDAAAVGVTAPRPPKEVESGSTRPAATTRRVVAGCQVVAGAARRDSARSGIEPQFPVVAFLSCGERSCRAPFACSSGAVLRAPGGDSPGALGCRRSTAAGRGSRPRTGSCGPTCPGGFCGCVR